MTYGQHIYKFTLMNFMLQFIFDFNISHAMRFSTPMRKVAPHDKHKDFHEWSKALHVLV